MLVVVVIVMAKYAFGTRKFVQEISIVRPSTIRRSSGRRDGYVTNLTALMSWLPIRTSIITCTKNWHLRKHAVLEALIIRALFLVNEKKRRVSLVLDKRPEGQPIDRTPRKN